MHMLDLKVLDHSHELIFRNADVEGVVVPVNRSVLEQYIVIMLYNRKDTQRHPPYIQIRIEDNNYSFAKCTAEPFEWGYTEHDRSNALSEHQLCVLLNEIDYISKDTLKEILPIIRECKSEYKSIINKYKRKADSTGNIKVVR